MAVNPGFVQLSITTGSGNTSTVSQLTPASTVTSAGQTIVGGVLSITVTLIVQLAVKFPQSVTV